jgi:DNA-binding MarR family transcriptional regulator
MADDDAWRHQLGHLLWEVSSRVQLLGETELAETPLTFPSIGLLDQIHANPGSTVAEIARRVPKTPQALSQVAARLEKLGYLERHVTRGRGIGLHITEAGEAARVRGNEIEQRLEARLAAVLGDERFEQLRALLEHARDGITALEQEADA